MKQRKDQTSPRHNSGVRGGPARWPHWKQEADLLEDIQSHDDGDPKELGDLNLLLEVTAAVRYQLDVL